MDPSGIVYEAVESNTVSGVTATVWYAEDAQGTNAMQYGMRRIMSRLIRRLRTTADVRVGRSNRLVAGAL